MISSFKTQSSCCHVCGERGKLQFCHVPRHVEGCLLSKICPKCNSKTKVLHCDRLDHRKGETLDLGHKGCKTEPKPKPRSKKTSFIAKLYPKHTDQVEVRNFSHHKRKFSHDDCAGGVISQRGHFADATSRCRDEEPDETDCQSPAVPGEYRYYVISA